MTARKALETERQRQQEEDVRAVLATETGRRFVWALLDGHAGVFGASYTGDGVSGAYGEGRRSVGIGLMLLVQRLAPDLYVRMVQEQLEALRRDASAVSPEEGGK